MEVPRRNLYIQNLAISGEHAYCWAKDVAELRKRRQQVERLRAEIQAIQAEPMSRAELRARLCEELERNRLEREQIVYALLTELQQGTFNGPFLGTNQLYNALAIPELMKEELFAAIDHLPEGSSQASKQERIALLQAEIARLEEEMKLYGPKAEWFADQGQSLPPEDWLRVAEWVVEEWMEYARYFSDAVDWNGQRLSDARALEAYYALELDRLPKAPQVQPGYEE
ncbi:MAG: hypothetical protein D6736_08295 [Nitrospinota bacterium]|nr:MAG: hypothetical protein D6736_08295 [Nitrospinota bacterium]